MYNFTRRQIINSFKCICVVSILYDSIIINLMTLNTLIGKMHIEAKERNQINRNWIQYRDCKFPLIFGLAASTNHRSIESSSSSIDKRNWIMEWCWVTILKSILSPLFPNRNDQCWTTNTIIYHFYFYTQQLSHRPNIYYPSDILHSSAIRMHT